MTIGKLSGQCDFGQKGQSYCNQRGQSCVAKRVKVAWLFHLFLFNEKCDLLSPRDRILSLVSLTGDNLGTKIQKKYENRQKKRRERENINSLKVIDFTHFTDLYFLFL